MKYLLLLLLSLSCYSQDRLRALSIFQEDKEPPLTIYEEVIDDYKHFYSKDTIDNSLFWIGLGAVFANTNIDHGFSHWYANNIRSEKLDKFSGDVKHFGEGSETLPILLGATLIGYGLEHYGLDYNGYVYDWGSKSLRTMLVGGPMLLASQRIVGAGRHVDGDDSYWKPFNDANGVSGHAFMGAVPFITAAHMTDDPLLKATFYAGSTLCAWSRVNDDHHYLSQAVLGWSLAYVSSLAVFEKQSPIQLAIICDGNRYGISFSLKF